MKKHNFPKLAILQGNRELLETELAEKLKAARLDFDGISNLLLRLKPSKVLLRCVNEFD